MVESGVTGISKLSNCFPYCMGLHLLGGSVSQPLLMRGAGSWADGALLSSRSCIATQASPSGFVQPPLSVH